MSKRYFLRLMERHTNRQRLVIRHFLQFILLRLSTFVIGYPVSVNRVLEQKLSRNFLKGLETFLSLTKELETYTGLQKLLSPVEESRLARRLINKRATRLTSRKYKRGRDYYLSNNKIIVNIISYKDKRQREKHIFSILFTEDFNLIQDKILLKVEGEYRMKKLKYLLNGNQLLVLDEDELSRLLKIIGSNTPLSVSDFNFLKGIFLKLNHLKMLNTEDLQKIISIFEKELFKSSRKLKSSPLNIFLSVIDFNFLKGILLKLNYLKMLNTGDLQEIISIFDEPSLRKGIVFGEELFKSPRKLKSSPLELEEREKLKKFWLKELEVLNL
jgi:hypothetical protein